MGVLGSGLVRRRLRQFLRRAEFLAEDFGVAVLRRTSFGSGSGRIGFGWLYRIWRDSGRIRFGQADPTIRQQLMGVLGTGLVRCRLR